MEPDYFNLLLINNVSQAVYILRRPVREDRPPSLLRGNELE